ncbi:MAG: hypothetical protein IPJ01_12750 [Micavibrio sp.]|nr:hypothetical protein [Micavibrio sp.]
MSTGFSIDNPTSGDLDTGSDDFGVDFDAVDASPSVNDQSSELESPAAPADATPPAPVGLQSPFPNDPAPQAPNSQQRTPDLAPQADPQRQAQQSNYDFGAISADSVRAAASFGMRPEHIARYRDNPAALEAAIYQFNANLLRSNPFPQQQFPPQQQPFMPPGFMPGPMMAPQMQPPAMMPPQQAFPAPGMMGPQPPAAPLTGPAPGQFQLWKDPSEREAFDEEFANKLDGMNAHYAQTVAALQSQLAQVQGFTQAQVQEQQFRVQQAAAIQDHDAFDRAVESLGADYEVLFGKGTHQTLDRRTMYFENRRAVHGAYTQLRNQYAQQGLNPDPRALLTSAAAIVLGPQWQFIDGQARASRQSSRSVARPNRGVNAAEPGDTAAQQFVSNFMASRGVHAPQMIETEDDSIGLL